MPRNIFDTPKFSNLKFKTSLEKADAWICLTTNEIKSIIKVTKCADIAHSSLPPIVQLQRGGSKGFPKSMKFWHRAMMTECDEPSVGVWTSDGHRAVALRVKGKDLCGGKASDGESSRSLDIPLSVIQGILSSISKSKGWLYLSVVEGSDDFELSWKFISLADYKSLPEDSSKMKIPASAVGHEGRMPYVNSTKELDIVRITTSEMGRFEINNRVGSDPVIALNPDYLMHIKDISSCMQNDKMVRLEISTSDPLDALLLRMYHESEKDKVWLGAVMPVRI
jgi:hypothetical protein